MAKLNEISTEETGLGSDDDLIYGKRADNTDFKQQRTNMLPGNGHEWEIFAQSTAPNSPTTKTLWIDTSS